MDHTKKFYHILVNTTLAGIINFTVWFAITFFVFLQTKSVFATGMISGIYLVATAVSGFWFGSIVDHHHKKNAMMASSIVSLIAYFISFIIYITADPNTFKNIANSTLWIFILVLMAGVISGNIRNIALPTIVTLLFPENKRDKANGLSGTAGGISFLITSVISGFLVGLAGMYYVLILAVGVTLFTILHLLFISIPENRVVHLENQPPKIDIKGTLSVISKIPGLLPLILFSAFNNFLGGVYMALMDAYGLSLVSVQVWGVLWGVISTGFIIGGIIISKRGLGKNPLKSMFIANFIIWTISTVFTIYPSIIILVMGMYLYIITMPYIEASEQTILQNLVPAERQGRVFGFAQSVEQAASPFTAFLIGPLTQFIFIPFMTTGTGVELIGDWFGTGPSRGIALVFTVTGIIGLCMTFFAMRTKYYRQLSERYLSRNEK